MIECGSVSVFTPSHPTSIKRAACAHLDVPHRHEAKKKHLDTSHHKTSVAADRIFATDAQESTNTRTRHHRESVRDGAGVHLTSASANTAHGGVAGTEVTVGVTVASALRGGEEGRQDGCTRVASVIMKRRSKSNCAM